LGSYLANLQVHEIPGSLPPILLRWTTLLFSHDFKVSNVNMYSSSGFAIRRISICRYKDNWPYNGRFSLYRDFELQNSEVYAIFFHGNPDFPNADIRTAGPTMGAFHFIGIPDFATPKCMDFLSMGFPISRMPISRWPYLSSGLSTSCS
jgi:hypothetical protein